MGLFGHKQQPVDKTLDEKAADALEDFFDDNFREELRSYGRSYFDSVIRENGDMFKKELDGIVTTIKDDVKQHVIAQLDDTVAQVNSYLKEHVTKELDDHFQQYGAAMKDAQDAALVTLTKSKESLEQQHKELAQTLEKKLVDQEDIMTKVLQENRARIVAMKDAQDAAMQTLNNSVKAVEKQHQALAETLKKNIESQQEMMLSAFEENTAKIIEHYLLGAMGEQYDIKAQLPAIIKQLESKKQAIVDDIKL